MDCVQHQFNNNWLDGVSQENKGPLILAKIQTYILTRDTLYTSFFLNCVILNIHQKTYIYLPLLERLDGFEIKHSSQKYFLFIPS